MYKTITALQNLKHVALVSLFVCLYKLFTRFFEQFRKSGRTKLMW